MDVILLHSNTHTFRPFMWPSSGWREVEYKYSCYHHPEYKATYVIETYRWLLCNKITSIKPSAFFVFIINIMILINARNMTVIKGLILTL